MIQLGDLARDKITGFEGIVVCRSEYLSNCIRYSLQPTRLQENGAPVEWGTFDEGQIEIVQAKGLEKKVEHGGPMPAPERW